MRTYETLYIVRPDLSEEEVAAVAKDVEAQITEGGGSIVRAETWGKRRLAYEVQKFSEGCYVLVRFTGSPELSARLENYFRLTDPVIRYLLLHLDERTLRLEARQKKRKEAEVRATTNAPVADDAEEEAVARTPRSRRYAEDDDETDEEE